MPQSISPPPALDPDDVFEFSDTLSSPAVSNEQDCSTEVSRNPSNKVGSKMIFAKYAWHHNNIDGVNAAKDLLKFSKTR